MPQLTRMMKRVQPHLGKMVPNIEGEPNFYEMESKHPLPAPSAAMTHQMSYSYEYFPPMYANNVAPPPQYNPYYGHNMPMPAQPSSNVPSRPNPYYNSNMPPPAQPYPDYYDYSAPHPSPYPYNQYEYPPQPYPGMNNQHPYEAQNHPQAASSYDAPSHQYNAQQQSSLNNDAQDLLTNEFPLAEHEFLNDMEL
eukprot:scaffold149522_cov125-Cyclotella_meneghiniana.AAC.1